MVPETLETAALQNLAYFALTYSYDDLKALYREESSCTKKAAEPREKNSAMEEASQLSRCKRERNSLSLFAVKNKGLLLWTKRQFIGGNREEDAILCQTKWPN